MDEVLVQLIDALKGATPEVARLIVLYLWLKFGANLMFLIGIIGSLYVIVRGIVRGVTTSDRFRSVAKDFPADHVDMPSGGALYHWDQRRRQELRRV